MKKLKIAGWALLALIAIALVAVFSLAQILKPSYDGVVDTPELKTEVTVYYDTYGIPHIYAKNELDAFRTLGYVHAQDRLWQMELLRRIARGGLSEVFGRDLVDTDKFMLSLGIDEATKRTLTTLDYDSKMVREAQAYLDGVNLFVEEGPTPIEFHLTSLEKQPFTLEDVLNTIGYMSFSFAMAHKTDPLLSNIQNKLGPEYVKDLSIDVDSNTVWIKNYKAHSDVIPVVAVTAVHNALDKLPVPQFIGSNSWVLGPGKTKSGKVILANDPHIGFAQPSVWYEAHVVTPEYEKYGYHLAGVPFPLLAHDRNLAYGLTMFENDDIDFYEEEIHPDNPLQYRDAEEWKALIQLNKTIKVKDSSSVNYTYAQTSRGPLLNGVFEPLDSLPPVSMSWSYTRLDNRVLNALYGISHATNISEFESHLPDIHAPGLNVMYGDAEGNVAWWATARLYEMPEEANTKMVLKANAGQDPIRYLDFRENPSAVNPPWGYVYSANNQPDSVSGLKIPGYYLPENRARRIVELLEPKNDWDRESVSEMILDVTSPVNPTIAQDLVGLVADKEMDEAQSGMLEKLLKWDGNSELKSVEPALYHRWMYYILKNTLADELGEELFKQVMSTHFLKRAIAPLTKNNSSIWWDNVGTDETKETRSDIVLKSFEDAWSSLEADLGIDVASWTWDRLHVLEHEHPIGQVPSLRDFFNVGPFPIHGTREVINNLAFPYTDDFLYRVNAGPSTRRIIDFSDIENSMSILPTGQSGNPLSDHYEDQAEMYVNGQFRKMMMNKKEIQDQAGSVLKFRPQK
ncbi:penicillin acylase family protein [Lentiprolixibacter aurantiacus]|uniref:Penicillin acylase family protein n=1 Tax=Lentiprolixibacter aurantiacus TaxID=2993939 RepID=A0AAE3SP15_9FLAO|nr:penicillin acylase family protein [Lentiprolixibacter aurantiacus]MCX2719731.1 penicillin acylase family protein [Lentiprolixibacter aurantiacus]